jgi:flagellar biosynthesis/type III secretory pathway protein FliH
MEVRQKQQFLVEEIINKGYDANNFAVFIQEQREDGDDLSNWSFSSLKEAVEKFKGNREVLLSLKEEPQAPAEKDMEDKRQLAGQEAQEENGQMYRSHIENLEAEITRVEEGIREGNRSRSDSVQQKMNRALTQAKEDANRLSVLTTHRALRRDPPDHDCA